jgi:AraC-like DNA-binding protein
MATRIAPPPERLPGTMFVSGATVLYVGPLVAAKRHAHHATQIVIAPHGLAIEDGAGGRMRARTAIIPPRMPHGHGACDHAALLYLDGDDAASRALARDAAPRCATWRRDALAVRVPDAPTPALARALIAAIRDAIAPARPPAPRHPATRRMCAYLEASDDVDLARLSRAAGLSPRQMRHAFARDIGLSMRAYVRWKRLRRAIVAVEAGASLSTAATASGFADSAHLTRVFRALFGMTPTQGLSAVTWRTLD